MAGWEERLARAFAMNPNWVEEEIIPWADSKAEFKNRRGNSHPL